MLVFPGQELTDEQHIDFARHFGPLETTIAALNLGAKLRVPDKLADVSNLNSRSEIWGEKSRTRMLQLANRLWHTDSSFKYLPARASLLYARTVAPIGGHTEFTDLRAAYDALDEGCSVGSTAWSPSTRWLFRARASASAPLPRPNARACRRSRR